MEAQMSQPFGHRPSNPPPHGRRKQIKDATIWAIAFVAFVCVAVVVYTVRGAAMKIP